MNNALITRIQQMTTEQIEGALQVMNKKPSNKWTPEEILVEDKMLWVLLDRGHEDLFMKWNDMV